MLKKIIFRGYLQEMYPEGISLEADSAAEAITALGLYPGFRVQDGVQHTMTLPDFQSPDAFYAATIRPEIVIEPFVGGAGGKKAGFLQIAIGVALVVFSGGIAAAGIGALGMTGAAAAAATATLTANIAMMGAMMVLGGVVALLMKQPKADSSSSDPTSNYLGGASGNTTAAGTPIPLLLGTYKCAGHYLGFNITATNLGQPGPPAALDAYPSVFSASVDSEFNITINSQGTAA
ncbi:putative tail protein [Xylophilus phage Lumi]|nr:putative tail protein [Xylophilus phage Lumi]